MRPFAEVSTQEPEGMEGVYTCPECRRDTVHQVLTIVNSSWSDDAARYWDHFLTVRCKGCGTVSFCHVSKCDLDEDYDERGRPFLPHRKVHYPRIGDDKEDLSAGVYVQVQRIQELQNIQSKEFDLTKLIQMIVELNRSYDEHSYLSCTFLLRSILDHVPPIFGLTTFKEIANNYAGGGKSFRQHMQHLENCSRKIADSYLHMPVRKNESIPTGNQVEFRADIDVLLAELIRALKVRP